MLITSDVCGSLNERVHGYLARLDDPHIREALQRCKDADDLMTYALWDLRFVNADAAAQILQGLSMAVCSIVRSEMERRLERYGLRSDQQIDAEVSCDLQEFDCARFLGSVMLQYRSDDTLYFEISYDACKKQNHRIADVVERLINEVDWYVNSVMERRKIGLSPRFTAQFAT